MIVIYICLYTHRWKAARKKACSATRHYSCLCGPTGKSVSWGYSRALLLAYLSLRSFLVWSIRIALMDSEQEYRMAVRVSCVAIVTSTISILLLLHLSSPLLWAHCHHYHHRRHQVQQSLSPHDLLLPLILGQCFSITKASLHTLITGLRLHRSSFAACMHALTIANAGLGWNRMKCKWMKSDEITSVTRT